MNSEKIKERKDYIDITKGIAIICVVLVHATTTGTVEYGLPHFYLIRIISGFVMPTFFFLNGFLYNSKYAEKPIAGSLKKIKAYYIPFLEYNIAYLILHNLFAVLHLVDENNGNGLYSARDYVKHFVLAITGHREYFSGALWFLGSIMIISVIYIWSDYLGSILWNGKYKYVIITVIVFAVALLGMLKIAPETMKLRRSCLDIVFFYAGHLFRKFDLFEKTKKYHPVIIVSGIIMLILSGVLTGIALGRPFSLCWAYYLIGIWGAVTIVLIAKMPIIEKIPGLKFVGQSSLEIMALHFLAFKVVTLIGVVVYGLDISRMADYPVLQGINGCWFLLYVIAGVSLPTLFNYVKMCIKKQIKDIRVKQ